MNTSRSSLALLIFHISTTIIGNKQTPSASEIAASTLRLLLRSMHVFTSTSISRSAIYLQLATLPFRIVCLSDDTSQSQASRLGNSISCRAVVRPLNLFFAHYNAAEALYSEHKLKRCLVEYADFGPAASPLPLTSNPPSYRHCATMGRDLPPTDRQRVEPVGKRIAAEVNGK